MRLALFLTLAIAIIASGEINKPENLVYYCAYSIDTTTMHIGLTDTCHVTITGQDTIESFDTEAELEERVDELKGEGWYAAWKEENEP